MFKNYKSLHNRLFYFSYDDIETYVLEVTSAMTKLVLLSMKPCVCMDNNYLSIYYACIFE